MNSADVQAVLPVDVADLRLDPQNPRLPPDLNFSLEEQHAIALYINKHFDPLKIAQSIEEHRFFESEPLIAVKQGGVYVVIEGNRRLTALMGLRDSNLRGQFADENRGWVRLSGATAPTEVPVLVVSHPKDVAALLGYRHISGIEPWDPYAQARFIAQLVDRDGHSLDEVAELVGRTRTEISSKYRDFEVLRQVDEMGIDTSRARKSFGVFNNAMQRRGIRKYIGAPDPRQVDPGFWPLTDGNEGNARTLLKLIFGDRRGEGRVIFDSRQLGDLAKVLNEESGSALEVLIRSGDIAEAMEATQDLDERFARAVRRARDQAKRAADLEPNEVSPNVRALVDDLASIASALHKKLTSEVAE